MRGECVGPVATRRPGRLSDAPDAPAPPHCPGRLDGRRSLGENLSDLVGVTIALDAYRLHAAANGIDTKAKRDGFSGEQRLFLGWAQLLRTQATEAALRAEIDSGNHSPARYRVNGVVRNLQAW
ncbi:M13-type metalloendopeptidase [Tahibacter sp.]|uniref:M13-type metalloendopeptidase n=1 Tax=Tahibacter sp. TaxID=2056211 RepID=UPI0028C50D24|nr:M13-type metalloendopeptidase [Tahibacter sp.]